MPFFNLLLGLAWLVFAVLLFLDWQWNMGFIPGIAGDLRPLFIVVALALLAHNVVRWWMLRERLRAAKEEMERSHRRPTPAKVVDPTFRFYRGGEVNVSRRGLRIAECGLRIE